MEQRSDVVLSNAWKPLLGVTVLNYLWNVHSSQPSAAHLAQSQVCHEWFLKWKGKLRFGITHSASDTWTGLISLPTVDCTVRAHPQALSSDPFSLGDRSIFHYEKTNS